MVGFFEIKKSLFPLSPQPVILREAKGEVAESILLIKNPRPPGDGGP